jgi:Elongation factor SelB, winged helix.
MNIVKKETLSFIRKKSKNDAFHSYVELSNLIQSLKFSEKWASFIIEELVKSKDVKLKSGRIFLAEQSSKISKEIKKDLKKINDIINNIDSNIISIKKLILSSKLNPRKTKELVFLLVDNKSLYRINDDIIISVNAFNKLLSLIRKYFANNKTMSISDFKILSNLTRKNAIPILEYFDNNQFTTRDGNNRFAGEFLYVE